MLVRLATRAMATRFELVLDGEDEVRLRAAGEAALEEIEEADRRLSRFRRDSLVSRIVRLAHASPQRLDEDLYGLFELCARVSRESGGAFDVTLGTGGFTLDPEARTIALASSRTLLDLGAVGKGHGIDLAVRVLREARVECALLHGGTSTAYGLGAPPGTGGWRVAVAGGDGKRAAVLRDGALSASAQHGRLSANGIGHVLDPRTGSAPETAEVAAVTASTAALADAWSTALLILGGVPRCAPIRNIA